jgi:PmbA protein
VNAGPLIDALRDDRPGGRRITAWSLYVSEFRRAAIGTKDRETGHPHAPMTLARGLSGRYKLVWDDGRVSRGTMERRAIEREPAPLLLSARAAAYDDPDGTDILGPAVFPDVESADPATESVASGAIATFAPRLAAIRQIVGTRGIRTWSGSIQAASAHSRVVTSAGLDVTVPGTSASWSVSFDGEIGAGLSARRFEPETEFEARVERLAGLALALRQRAQPRPAGLVPVVLHPDVVEDYVLGVLLHNLDGAQVAHATSAFRRDQFGSTAAVLREDLTLRHDPLLPMAAGTYRFTQEGLPARRCSFIEKGRLVTPLLDLKYGRRLGLPATPAPSAMDTLFFEGDGSLGDAAAIAEAAGGVLVLSVLGVHTQDFSSGDFSLSAPQSLALGASGIEGRIKGTISGNLFEILRAPETALVRFAGEHTPGLLCRCRFDPGGA